MERIEFENIIDSKFVINLEEFIGNKSTYRHLFVSPACSIQKGGYIIFDFGKEYCGRLHIRFGVNNDGKIRVRTGESVYEVCAEIGEKNAGNYHSLRDAVYPIVSWSDFSTTETGFRFARIDLVEGEKVDLSSVFIENSSNHLTRIGQFASNDSRLNEIYEVGARTISLCTREDEIWDGIKRDRVVWIGDFYPELIGSFSLYGNIHHYKKILDMIEDFKGSWVNCIPSYSAWWLICLCKYYELTGDKEYFLSKLSYVNGIIHEFNKIIEDDGSINFKNSDLNMFENNEFFIDWPTNLTSDSEIGWRYLVTYALEKTDTVLNVLGENNANIETAVKNLDKYSYPRSTFKQVVALGVIANRIDKDKALEILKNNDSCGISAFMSYIIFEALAKLGQTDLILDSIKHYFGAMLDLGATTFWEDFDMEWLKDDPLPITALPGSDKKYIHPDFGKFCYVGLRHSLCHGWSSGFIALFNDYVLGVQIVEPGYRKIKIRPHLCGLTKAEGTIPTVYGEIHIKHELINGKIETELKLPEGIIAE